MTRLLRIAWFALPLVMMPTLTRAADHTCCCCQDHVCCDDGCTDCCCKK